MPEEEKTYTLLHPVVVANKGYHEVTLRRFKAKHLKSMAIGGETSFGDFINIIAGSSGLLPAVVEEFDIEDITNLAELLMDFLPLGFASGSKTQ